MKRIKNYLLSITSKKREKGAIVAEATIALTAYIFAIYMVLSIVSICFVQAKMGVALNAAAKEMSQYAFLYETLNLSKHMSGEGGKSSEIMDSFATVLNKISKGTSNFSSDISSMFAQGASQAQGDSAAEYIKNGVGMGLAQQLMKKNLVEFEGDTPDAFLRRCHVKDGFKGLNFLNTTFLTDENQSEVGLIVSYKVEVVRLLDTDVTFNFVQRADTRGWGKGVSLKNPASSNTAKTIWESSNLTRGNSIITSEKKQYKYTSASYNFHAYEPGSNQFVRIRSLDTTVDSYANDPSAIEKELNSTYQTLYKGVSGLDSNVPVTDSSGKSVTVNSNPNSRTYKIVLVIPEGADTTAVNTAVQNFQASNPGVTVEVKSGYGSGKGAQTPATEGNTQTEQ